MAADGLGTETGNPCPACCSAAPLCYLLALALGIWPVGAACPVTLCLPPAVRLHGVVPRATGAVYPMPPMWVSSCLAHACSLQWLALMDGETTIAYPCRVLEYPRQPPSPYGSHGKAVGSLCSLPQGTSCPLAGRSTSPATWPPLPCYQVLGYHLFC